MIFRSGLSGSLPHVRGGVSDGGMDVTVYIRSSPRAWGCFLVYVAIELFRSVFPTCVGVFPAKEAAETTQGSLPHVRGGVSSSLAPQVNDILSSPRAWGCFLADLWEWLSGDVFPTCVGVFPSAACRPHRDGRLPHVRGGVSRSYSPIDLQGESSPRAWGCFAGT